MPEFCAGHGEIQRRITSVENKQGGRPCGGHEARLKGIEKSDDDQWAAINSLRRMVYMGAGAAGVLAFLGSIIGSVLKR